MAKRKRAFPAGTELVDLRKHAGMNQAQFWARFGITQSAGSRYESGRRVPRPARLLMAAYFAGKLTDADVAELGEGV